MACVRSLPQKSFTLETTNTALRQVWGEWIPVVGLTRVGFVLNIRNVVGNFQARPCYQVAAVRAEVPGAIEASAVNLSSNGFHAVQSAMAITDQLLIRFGVQYNNSSGGTLGSANVTLDVHLAQCGKVLGGDTILVHAGETSDTATSYFPVSGWSSCIGLDKILAAFIVADNLSNHLEYSLVGRSAVDPKAPNAWQQLEAGWANPDVANSERNTGERAVTPLAVGDNMYFQVGVAVRKKSGATSNPRATISVVTACRYCSASRFSGQLMGRIRRREPPVERACSLLERA